ncbi:MAG: Unknown protein [uncultured Thiotrichaceae bacterium]|uniref:DUF5362 domain-containing protein n=1 Tax=uncultured Thiotrichaceae bacterium TaxID=298394 RepID=A0A6S6TR92_9GAMM|nr:MAG: Unknown protein [uncultured Thiotrichaceae bacterium]
MSTQDAYAPPKSTVRDVSGGGGLMTDSIVSSLRKTRPWVLLLAILGFIGAAFMVIAAVPMLLGGGMMGSNMEGMDGLGMFGGGMIIGMGVFYLILGVIYFMASLYLLRYAGSIKRAVAGMQVADLEVALSQQASFWKLMGILTLITIVAIIGMMVVGIGSAVFMSGV